MGLERTTKRDRSTQNNKHGKLQVESTTQLEYALPDLRTPVDIVIPSNTQGTIRDVVVGLRINHSWPADLKIQIIHPDGSEVLLADHNGNGNHRDGSEVWGEGSRSCNGDLAYFSDDASESISARKTILRVLPTNRITSKP